ncbi:MAG TPA: 3-isopropylmalate dehydratase small subunit [Planctomycetota bacterium]|nr:3-isopropylmalate dehydratase small subunit [Planctomycetota bacterium]
MPLEKITRIESTGVVVPGHDIDTDRIIPARFMKCVTFDGLGDYLFYDVRFDKNGALKNHPLDDPKHKGAAILFSGRNFGCGSSREHAPQALQKFGIRAVVAESFAEIFAGNCTTLGIPCVMLSEGDLGRFVEIIQRAPSTKIVIDLPSETISGGGHSARFQMKGGARDALLKGEWDALGQLLDGMPQVRALASKLAYV